MVSWKVIERTSTGNKQLGERPIHGLLALRVDIKYGGRRGRLGLRPCLYPVWKVSALVGAAMEALCLGSSCWSETSGDYVLSSLEMSVSVSCECQLGFSLKALQSVVCRKETGKQGCREVFILY